MPTARKRTRKPADPLGRWRIAAPADDFTLAAFDPGDKPLSTGGKSADKARVEELAGELDALQNLFHADRRHKLLVVLQGIDTSGKDGTLRAVFGRMSPIGVRTVAWQAPSDAERARDFLWRIHWQVPALGEIVGFNRSHYEDVLVPVVEGWIDEAETRRRYAHINGFERLLCETGTVVLKFMLHISRDEQRDRLQERIDDPAKRWKFQRGDLLVRGKWDAYQQAYALAIAATSTAWAPWYVVPADSKTHRNLMIATGTLAAPVRGPQGRPLHARPRRPAGCAGRVPGPLHRAGPVAQARGRGAAGPVRRGLADGQARCGGIRLRAGLQARRQAAAPSVVRSEDPA